MDYYVYLLTNANKTVLYTGVTSNLSKRVYEHKNHLAKCSFTDRYNVEYLVYYESTADVTAAIEREKQIKGWNRKRKEKLIASKNPDWKDLYESILEKRISCFLGDCHGPLGLAMTNRDEGFSFSSGDCHAVLRDGSQ